MTMRKSSTILLQIIIALVGVAALAFMLWEPTIEGRNAGASLSQIYFNDPFLLWAYSASIAFFVGLYQTFKLLGFIGKNKTFSEPAIKSLRTIRYCSTILVAFALAAEAYLMIVRPGDDIAGGVFMGLLLIFVFGTIATLAGMFEKIWQHALDIKSENDLTV